MTIVTRKRNSNGINSTESSVLNLHMEKLEKLRKYFLAKVPGLECGRIFRGPVKYDLVLVLI